MAVLLNKKCFSNHNNHLKSNSKTFWVAVGTRNRIKLSMSIVYLLLLNLIFPFEIINNNRETDKGMALLNIILILGWGTEK